MRQRLRQDGAYPTQVIDNLSGFTSWNDSIGSHEAKVDVELMEDMMDVEMLPGNNE
jgi:hypothetical protein